MKYTEWKSKISGILSIFTNVTMRDINDLPYWDLWANNTDPYEVSFYLLKNNKYTIPPILSSYSDKNVKDTLIKISKKLKPI